MINARELMIGNIVEEADKKVPIKIEAWHIQAIEQNPDLVNPITLTDEVLESSGFVNIEGWPKNILFNKGFGVRWHLEKLCYLHTTVEIEFLHQLQNIYYWSMGEELKIIEKL